MKKASIIFLFLFCARSCFGQTKEEKFKSAVKGIVTAFSRQDSAQLSRYIDRDMGVYHLDRVGVFDHYYHYKSIGFSNKRYPQALLRYAKNIQLLPLKYSALPTFNC